MATSYYPIYKRAYGPYGSTGGGTTPGGIYTPSGDETATYTSATAMPNQINAVGTRKNTSQPLEFQNPTTLAWVTGTVTSTAGGNEFAATLAGVTPAIYPAGTLKMRVVGFPTVFYNPLEVNVTGGESARAAFVSDGDSLDYGALTSNPPETGWAGVLYPQLDTAKFGQRLIRAVSGQTFQAMLDRQAQTMALVDTTTYKLVIVTIGGGANSLMRGVSVADLKSQRIQYIQNWKTWASANGVQVRLILLSLTLNLKDYGGEFGVTLQNYEDRRQQLNQEAFIGYSSVYGAGYYVNWDANAAMRDGTNPTYYTNDGQHFTDEGQRVRAGIAKPYVLAAQAGTPLAPVATPTAPTLATPTFSASATGTSTIHLVRGNVVNATTYIVTRATDSSFTLNVATIDMSGGLERDDTGLNPVTTYYYRIQASATNYSPSSYALANAKTLSATPVVSGNISRLFVSDQGVSNNGTTFRWADTTSSGDVLSTGNVGGVSVLPNVVNGYPAIRLNGTQLNGLVKSGISGAQPFQILLVARLPNSGAQLGMAGLGNDISGGAGGTIADMLALQGKLDIHTYSSAGLNDNFAPFINYGTFQIFGIRHDGTNGRSYASNPPSGLPESAATAIVRGALPDTVYRIGASHTPGLGFDSDTLDVCAVLTQALYDDAQWAQNIAALKYQFGIS